MAKKELKDQLKSYEKKINDIPKVIQPCKQCKYYDKNGCYEHFCMWCCWRYNSCFEVGV